MGVDSNSTSGLEALPVAIALVNLGLVEERAVGKENWRVTERRVNFFPIFPKVEKCSSCRCLLLCTEAAKG